ncbi:MAG: hypothetical protein ACLUWN_05945 [Clostridia bacterium]|jgi:membrane protein
MNTIQKIMNILMKPNATLTNIIILPFFVIEVYLYVNLFITLLNITPSKKSKYSCMLSLIAIFIISRFLIPVPFNTIFNILIFVLLYLLFFKRPLIDTFLGIIIPFLLTTLFEIISSQVYTLIFNKPYTEAISLPLYHILFLIIVYSLLFIIWKLFKHLKLNITLFTNLNKKDSFSILSTVILGFITIFLQLYITAFYNNVLPGAIILLSIMCLVAYVFVSIFNIVKTKELEVANRDIKNLKLYNNTLKIMYDNIRAFKHDFHNIMNGIGRIYNCQ